MLEFPRHFQAASFRPSFFPSFIILYFLSFECMSETFFVCLHSPTIVNGGEMCGWSDVS